MSPLSLAAISMADQGPQVTHRVWKMLPAAVSGMMKNVSISRKVRAMAPPRCWQSQIIGSKRKRIVYVPNFSRKHADPVMYVRRNMASGTRMNQWANVSSCVKRRKRQPPHDFRRPRLPNSPGRKLPL